MLKDAQIGPLDIDMLVKETHTFGSFSGVVEAINSCINSVGPLVTGSRNAVDEPLGYGEG